MSSATCSIEITPKTADRLVRTLYTLQESIGIFHILSYAGANTPFEAYKPLLLETKEGLEQTHRDLTRSIRSLLYATEPIVAQDLDHHFTHCVTQLRTLPEETFPGLYETIERLESCLDAITHYPTILETVKADPIAFRPQRHRLEDLCEAEL